MGVKIFPLIEGNRIRHIGRITPLSNGKHGATHCIHFDDSTTIYVGQMWMKYWTPAVGGYVLTFNREPQPGYPNADIHHFLTSDEFLKSQPSVETLKDAMSSFVLPSPFTKRIINMRARAIGVTAYLRNLFKQSDAMKQNSED